MHEQKVTKLGGENYIFSTVTKTGSTFGHRIGNNGVEALRGQQHIPSNPHPGPQASVFFYYPLLLDDLIMTVTNHLPGVDGTSLQLYMAYTGMCHWTG